MAKKTKPSASPIVPPFLDRKVLLQVIRLMGMSAKQQIKVDAAGAFQMPEEVTFETNLRAPDNPEGDGLPFVASFKVTGKNPDGQVNLDISAVYAAVYSVHPIDGVTTEEIHSFGRLVCMMHLWPFWREYVHSTLSRLGLPSFVVPLFNPSGMQFQFDK